MMKQHWHHVELPESVIWWKSFLSCLAKGERSRTKSKAKLSAASSRAPSIIRASVSKWDWRLIKSETCYESGEWFIIFVCGLLFFISYGNCNHSSKDWIQLHYGVPHWGWKSKDDIEHTERDGHILRGPVSWKEDLVVFLKGCTALYVCTYHQPTIQIPLGPMITSGPQSERRQLWAQICGPQSWWEGGWRIMKPIPDDQKYRHSYNFSF